MRTFKKIDVLASGLLLLVLMGIIIYRPSRLLACYFLLGGWQVGSMLIHVFNGWFLSPGGPRLFFHRAVAITGLIVVLSEFFWPLCFIYFFLLVGAPVMGMIYAHLCWQECVALRKRPLTLLTGRSYIW